MKVSRLSQMEEYIAAKKFVSLDELCIAFNKSKNTIRRDVQELTQFRGFQKVYGGVKAVAQDPLHPPAPFHERNSRNVEAKEAIGALAAQLVEDGDVIFLDSGSTTINMVKHLSDRIGLTILTNNLYVALQCMETPTINVIVLGGQLNHSTACFLANFSNLDQLSQFNINKAFMASTGVSVAKGATHTCPEERRIKVGVMDQCDNCFLLVDSSKFDQSTLLTYAPLGIFQWIITERPPTQDYQNFCKEHAIQLLWK